MPVSLFGQPHGLDRARHGLTKVTGPGEYEDRARPRLANLAYMRVSTGQRSTARQNLVLHEAGIEDPVVFEEARGPPTASTRSSDRSSANRSPTRSRATPRTSPRCSVSYAAPATFSTYSTAYRSPRASTTARSPWTSPPATHELGIQPAAYEPKLDVDFTPLREQDLTAAGLGQAA